MPDFSLQAYRSFYSFISSGLFISIGICKDKYSETPSLSIFLTNSEAIHFLARFPISLATNSFRVLPRQYRFLIHFPGCNLQPLMNLNQFVSYFIHLSCSSSLINEYILISNTLLFSFHYSWEVLKIILFQSFS